MEFTESPGGEAVVGVAVIGEPPPEGREKLFQTMLEASNMFSGTVGSTLAREAKFSAMHRRRKHDIM